MKIRKLVKSLILSVFLMSIVRNSVSAANAPNFPTCSNPSGTLIASYNEGIHGIPGSTSEFRGQDDVFFVTDSTVLQCFCAENGSGIQSNWWKINGLSQDEIGNFTAKGWIYVDNGANWGLETGAYLVKNESYNCKPSPQVQQKTTSPAGPPVCPASRPDAPIITSIHRNGTQATLNWTKVDLATHYMLSYGEVGGNLDYGVPNMGNVTSFTVKELNPSLKYNFVVYAVNDCMPSEPSGVSGYSTGGEVLGWATTGNIRVLYTLVTGGIAFILIGKLLYKQSY